MADTVTTLRRFAGSIPIVALSRSPTAAEQTFAEMAASL
jgi:hypothetical protein